MRRLRLLAAITAGLQDSGLEADLVEPILDEAEEGNAPAQFIVASALEKAEDFEQALEWYRRSAQQGYLPARERLRRLNSNAA